MLKIAEGEALVTLADGTELTLRIDHETMILAEETADIPLPFLLERLQSGRMGALRTVLYAALRANHPEITLKHASSLAFEHFDVILGGLNVALKRAFPKAVEQYQALEDKQPGNRQARRATAAAGGKASSKAGAKRASSRKDGSA